MVVIQSHSVAPIQRWLLHKLRLLTGQLAVLFKLCDLDQHFNDQSHIVMKIKFTVITHTPTQAHTHVHICISTSGHVEILRVKYFISKQCEDHFYSKRAPVHKVSIK